MTISNLILAPLKKKIIIIETSRSSVFHSLMGVRTVRNCAVFRERQKMQFDQKEISTKKASSERLILVNSSLFH